MKRTLWTSIAATCVGIVNIIIFAVLCGLDKFDPRKMAYVFAVGFLFIAWIPMLLEWIFKMRFNFAFLIIFEIYMFLGLCVGSQWEMYTAGFYFDKIIHTFGGVMLALLIYEIFIKSKEKGKNNLSLFWLFVLIFSFSMMCGGVWEIYEYVTDGIMGNNAQHARRYSGRKAVEDTMLDIVCDFSGGIVGATIAVVIEAEKKKKANAIESGEQEIKKAS